jgi:hypothetical protein
VNHYFLGSDRFRISCRGTVSDFVLGSYVLCSKPKTKSDSTQLRRTGVARCSFCPRDVVTIW